MSASTQIVIKNNLDELQRLNELVSEFGGQHNFHVEEEYAVYLCLEEMVTNIVNYGWSDGLEHEIKVEISIDEAAIKIILQDDGVAFDPTKIAEPDTNKPAHERQVGGLGIHLVRQTVDEMWYERLDNKNILILKKKRKAAVAA